MYVIDGEAIRRFREALFLSQRDLAERAGVTQATISRLEHGLQDAQGGTIRKLAGALGIEPAALAGGSQQKTTSPR